jgi:hypothetical protein
MNWSYKEQRLFIEIAASAVTLEQLSKRLGRSPEAIRKMAPKLGISLKFDDARRRSASKLKAKGRRE